jgi:hypothetical protein
MIRSLIIAVVAMAFAGQASAACYADYKAKRNDPLRLHYGVIELPDAACASKSDASRQIADRLARADWKLLNVVSIFGPEGLDQRKESAGEYFLRF